MSEKITAKRVLNATKWSTFAEIMAKLATPIVNMVLARLLTPEAFGVVAAITIITSFADIFTDAGFQRFIIQHEYESDEELDNGTNVAFWSNLTLALTIYCVIFFFKKPLAEFVGCKDEYMGIAAAGLSVIFTTFSSTATARYKRAMNFKPLFYVRVTGAIMPFFVTIPLALILKNYWALVWGTLAQQFATSLLLTIISKWKPKFYFSFARLKKMLPFSLWNLLETLSIWFAGQAGIFIVSNKLDSYYLGLYKTSMSTVNSYMSLITASITSVLFSALSRCAGDEEKFRNTVFSFIKGVSLLVIPMGAGMFLYRDLVVRILLGSQWAEAGFFVGLWAIFSAITITFSNIASEVYRSTGKPIISFVLQLGYIAIYVPTILWGVGQDYRTLCIVSCFVRLCPVVADMLMLTFRYKISAVKMIGSAGVSIISAGVMSGVALLLQLVSGKVWWQILSIVICVVVYFGVALAFRPEREFLKGLIKRQKGEKDENADGVHTDVQP